MRLLSNLENYVSIIIPAKNIDFLLLNCIKKIRELYNTIEIILVLDDISNEKIEYDKVKILKSDNPNMSAKRNLGVKFSNYEYIAFIDSDAYPNKNWLEISLAFLEQNKNYSAVTGCQYDFPDSTVGQLCVRKIRFNRFFTYKKWTKIIDYKIKEHDCNEFVAANIIMRKKDYENLNGMNETIYLAEDSEFSSRIIAKGYKIRFIPEVSVFHRESKLIPFLKKVYCVGYYNSNNIVKGIKIKTLKENIIVLLPICTFFLYSLISFIGILLDINIYIILIFPVLVLFLICFEAIKNAMKMSDYKIYSFFFILFASMCFILVYLFSSLLGIINFPTIDIKKIYRHY